MSYRERILEMYHDLFSAELEQMVVGDGSNLDKLRRLASERDLLRKMCPLIGKRVRAWSGLEGIVQAVSPAPDGLFNVLVLVANNGENNVLVTWEADGLRIVAEDEFQCPDCGAHMGQTDVFAHTEVCPPRPLPEIRVGESFTDFKERLRRDKEETILSTLHRKGTGGNTR